MSDVIQFDGRGIECPDLMVAIRSFINRQTAGAMVHVVTVASTSVNNLMHYCSILDHEICAQNQLGSEFHFMIKLSGNRED